MLYLCHSMQFCVLFGTQASSQLTGRGSNEDVNAANLVRSVALLPFLISPYSSNNENGSDAGSYMKT